MENETKLSNQQQETLDRLLTDAGQSGTDVRAFVNAHLTRSQAAAVAALLKNETLVKAMLSSPQAKAVLDAMQKKEDTP
ncbi:MAG: hypothetical protein IKN72_06470 [Clostridia bacterium]|nr:hypothetical protein [Clostridia bacterium]MBR3553015.1 hypothetical protein [Clostridia bacterium]